MSQLHVGARYEAGLMKDMMSFLVPVGNIPGIGATTLTPIAIHNLLPVDGL